jgi:hypothetical protein
MPADSSPHDVLDEIAALDRGDDLARLVHAVAFAAADERRATLADGLAEIAERAGIKPEDAETRFGNVLQALGRDGGGGAESAGSATRALLSTLLARGVALSPPEGAEAQARVAEKLLWLSTHTSVDALSAADAALGDGAAGLWAAVAALVRKVDAGTAPLVGRAGALIGAAAIRESTSGAAREAAQALAGEVRDPIVRSLLGGAGAGQARERGSGGEALVTGEVAAPPRSAVVLVLLGVTGLLAALYVARLVGRLALRYRRPAELRITPRGVTFRSRTELLGRTLREQETVIPVEQLQRASREVRYPRLPLYAGLFALSIGSYLGVRLSVDGARAGSPELLGIGALVLAAGVGLDFLLESAGSGLRGRCRVVLVPRRGPALAMSEVDQASADAALALLRG